MGAIVFALAAALVSGCEKGPKQYAFSDYELLPAIELSPADMQHILTTARAMVAGDVWQRQPELHEVVYTEKPRGVFISAVRENDRALTAFGFGDSIEDALSRAAKLLRRLDEEGDPARFPLRVDVIISTSESSMKTMSARWRHDLAHEGVILETDPVVAALPQEIMGYHVIDEGGRYYSAGMKRLTRARVIGEIVRDSLQDKSEISYVRFTSAGITEAPDWTPNLLYGVNFFEMPVDEASLLRALIAGGEWLKNNIDKRTGRFNYRYYPSRNLDSAAYNHLRHAGTAYAMGEVFEITRDAAMLDAVKAALGWIEKEMDGPKPSDRAAGADFLALVEKSDGARVAKTGGAGLSIIAFAKYMEQTGDASYLPKMQALARFILFNLDENGRLSSKYYYDDKVHQPFDSQYYPGECALGLVRLHKIDGDTRWIDAATRIAAYLRTVRDAGKTADDIIHDHWLSIAANEIYPVTKDAALLAHAFTIGDAMERGQIVETKRADMFGAFHRKPTSTATASRVEALNALARLARFAGETERAERYATAAAQAANVLLRSQYNTVNSMFFPAPEKAPGGFMGGYHDPPIQIDYVQHNISALSGVWRDFVRKAGDDPSSRYGDVAKFFPAGREPEKTVPAPPTLEAKSAETAPPPAPDETEAIEPAEADAA
ncbi:hypothetical protein K8I61_04045 [bacterium]|nr:hypothetical protein [bacterium]